VFKADYVSTWVLTVQCAASQDVEECFMGLPRNSTRADNCGPAVRRSRMPLALSTAVACCATSAQLSRPGAGVEARFFLPTFLNTVKPHPLKY